MEQTEIVIERNGKRNKSHDTRYRRLFETAKDGIIILDGDTGRITDANPFLQDMLGYSLQELLGKALWEIVPVKDINAAQDAMRQLQNKEYVRYENLPLETKDGQHIQVEFVGNVYLVNDCHEIQCHIRDVTARRRNEEVIRTANGELRASVAQLLKRDEEMKSLIHLNELLQSCTTQAEAYQVVALVAPELFAGESGCLAMLHPRDQTMETVARWGDETAIVPSFSLEDCWALRRGKLHKVGDPRVDLLCHHFVHDPQAGYLCVPLIVASGTSGLLYLTGGLGTVGSSARQRLAVTAGQTIKQCLYSLRLRDELREQATHDPLTGMCNRRYLDESLSRELHRGRRGKSPLCVVMLDLDNFKPFNDTFGHDAGDSLLRQLGNMIRDKLRKSDISCRYGGDEFVVVLPDSSVADTEQRMEQILALVAELPTQNGAPRPDITISAGIASAPEHGSTAAELLQAADKAMYDAKHAGGDCVVVYQAHRPLETAEGASRNMRSSSRQYC